MNIDNNKLKGNRARSQTLYNEVSTEEIEYMSNVIQERDREINIINKDIKEINEIYRELATLVDSQGEHIDSISNNLEACCEKTKNGLEEIKKAEKKQYRCLIQ